MSLDACLPAELRGSSATITRTAAGWSGAGVYRVEAAGQTFVLKVSGESEPADARRRTLHIQTPAANAGLAPRIVHVDEERHAVVSDFVVDRSFPARYLNPVTREDALVQLGQTLRRVHDLPLPSDAPSTDPRELLATAWTALAASDAVPLFVGEAVQRVIAEVAPPCDRDFVLSHNDVNPTNLIYDGKDLLLLARGRNVRRGVPSNGSRAQIRWRRRK